MIRLPKFAELRARERFLLLGTAAVVLVSVMDRLVFGPWWRHIQAVRQEISQIEKEVQHQALLLSRKDLVMARFAPYQRYLKPAVASDLQMAALLEEMNSLAEASGVLVSEIKPLASELGERMQRYALDVRIECTLQEWVDLLFRVETSPALFEVVRAGLSIPENSPDHLEGYLRVASTVLTSTPLAPSLAGVK